MDFKVEKTGAGYITPADTEKDYAIKNENSNATNSIFHQPIFK